MEDGVGPRAGDERAGGSRVAQVDRGRRRCGDDEFAGGLARRDEVLAGEPGRAGDQDAPAHAAHLGAAARVRDAATARDAAWTGGAAGSGTARIGSFTVS
jgi:hypothetical protein